MTGSQVTVFPSSKEINHWRRHNLSKIRVWQNVDSGVTCYITIWFSFFLKVSVLIYRSFFFLLFQGESQPKVFLKSQGYIMEECNKDHLKDNNAIEMKWKYLIGIIGHFHGRLACLNIYPGFTWNYCEQVAYILLQSLAKDDSFQSYPFHC